MNFCSRFARRRRQRLRDQHFRILIYRQLNRICLRVPKAATRAFFDNRVLRMVSFLPLRKRWETDMKAARSLLTLGKHYMSTLCQESAARLLRDDVKSRFDDAKDEEMLALYLPMESLRCSWLPLLSPTHALE